MNSNNYAVVIGGSNIDIQGYSYKKLTMRDSNPGKVGISAGGVGRNISENLSRLNVKTKLLSIVGNDSLGSRIINECMEAGIDCEDIVISNNSATSVYLSILDDNKDMKVAISDMDLINQLDIDFIINKRRIIEEASVIILDTNLPKDTTDFILDEFSHKIIFVDTVSTIKAGKIKSNLHKIHTIKPNKLEAEILTGIQIKSTDDLSRATEYFLTLGVQRVFITLGNDGVYYGDETSIGLMKNPSIKPISTTGAGDAFTAAIAYAFLHNYDIKESVKFAMGASIIALYHENTINPGMSITEINKIIKELNL